MAENQSATRNEILARLRRVEGQIRGIQRMIEENRDCEAVVTQLMAARSALDKASLFVVTHHIQECLGDPSSPGGEKRLDRLIEFFLTLSSYIPESRLSGD